MGRFLGMTAGRSVVDMDLHGEKQWVSTRGQFGKQDPGKLRCWPDDRSLGKAAPIMGAREIL